MSIFPPIFAIVSGMLAYRFGKSRRDRGLPVTLAHRVWVGLLVWAFGTSSLCLAPVLASDGPFPSPGGRIAAALVCLAIGWAPLVFGIIATMALWGLRQPKESA